MLRAFLGALLFLLPVGLVSGQSFPSDGKSPAKASGAELLEAVCSGQVVVVGDKIGCGKEYLYFTGFADDELDWSLTGVTRGHFLSPTSDDAVLSAEGCEPHVANFGGTILLTRSFQGWVMEWYKAGVDTRNATRFRFRLGERSSSALVGQERRGTTQPSSMSKTSLLLPPHSWPKCKRPSSGLAITL